ncbi:PLC-like phosphodiesterase [Triangularia verruculosa]|uniref:Phosphoinositide phospholipase C n=1 Tax=Triangularia verruculosa TaxID=2587418 RepID=A0AAN7ARR0_9PEZI|nr:PLC-like phosphodiesterase [Triangularia verruculosa]
MSEPTEVSGPTRRLTAKLGKLNPFKSSRRSKEDEDEDDFGEDIDDNTVAGGGHSAFDNIHHDFQVSDALKSFLARQGVLPSKNDAEGLATLLDKPLINPPSSIMDRSHPLSEYFISSSHNTYLRAHQLYGKSDVDAYRMVLTAGARCVEIDAWDNDKDKDEPKVTHGYTLVSNVPFRAVCEVIRDFVDKEASLGPGAAPVLLSLENHCDPEGQLRLVQIMRDVFGYRLLSKAVREKGHEEQSESNPSDQVRLEELGNKIAVIVEYHIPGEVDTSDSSSDSSSDEEEETKKEREEYKARKKEAAAAIIIPELADIGVYAQSVKPGDDSWYAGEGILANGPHHHLINISEAGLARHVSDGVNTTAIQQHNSKHLMRVFPKGTRISSRNLSPVPFWGLGAQILALNWQRFDASMQLNDALFAGTQGYVLKPAHLLQSGVGKPAVTRKRLSLHVAGASNVPVPKGRDSVLRPYVTVSLVQKDGPTLEQSKRKQKTAGYKKRGLRSALAALHSREESPAETDPIWDETLNWEFEDDDLVFLRIFIKSDDSFASNPILAVAAVRLMYVVKQEWGFLRMLDLKGHETGCILLVRFEVEDL